MVNVPLQTPFVHASLVVHRLVSLQAVPFAFAGFEQPLTVHVPGSWHWSVAGQLTAPMQLPFTHWSAAVQVSPSLQVVPFALIGFEQVPDVGSHVPCVWHWSGAAQTTGLPPAQTPFWQVSVRVQAFYRCRSRRSP